MAMRAAKDLGGYPGLEPIGNGTGPLPQGLALASGRACVAAVLRHVRPARLLAPHFICDSAVVSAEELGISVVRYALDGAWLPVLEGPSEGTMLLVVDYFGLVLPRMGPLLEAWGASAIVDLSQSFYAKPPAGVWSFNSARKFLGVPDGAFLNGPVELAAPGEVNTSYCLDHLVLAALGCPMEGLPHHRRNNGLMSTAYHGISLVSRRMLERIDHGTVQVRRRSNFTRLHRSLKDINRAPIDEDMPTTAPLHYPLLLDRPVDLAAFHRAGIFAPRLWPDVSVRPGTPVEERERVLRSVPLPIDQRYSEEDMIELACRTRSLL